MSVMFPTVTQLDIAPTIAKLYDLDFKCSGHVIREVIDKYSGRKVVLLIIDSLGFQSYMLHKKSLSFVSKLAHNGLIYKCITVTKRTTPAIATVLCGLRPEEHRVYNTGDISLSNVKSVAEFLSEKGVRTGVIMEEKGALTFKNRVDIVVPIKDREDILLFDQEVAISVTSLVNQELDFIVAHMRSLDKLGYTTEAIKCINERTEQITSSLDEKWLITVCGDHPPHDSSDLYVPLIFSHISK